MAKKSKKSRTSMKPEEEKSSEEKQSSIRSWYRDGLLFLSVFIPVLLSVVLRASPNPTTTDEDDRCNFYMAESTLAHSGWGVFTARHIRRNEPVLGGEVVIQLPDLKSEQGLETLLHQYAWSAQVSGGEAEGTAVHSILPGLGMLANGHLMDYNVIFAPPAVDHAGLERGNSPGAGSVSHYYSLQHYAIKELEQGAELFVNYGTGWSDKIASDRIERAAREVPWLRKHGVCLDHIRAGPVSNIPHAGRGAFATRSLRAGTVLAPVPVIPIRRDRLMELKDGRQQLLLNYCLGHVSSSIVLYPYSPIVNLINHDNMRPNAVLRWSSMGSVLPDDVPIDILGTRQPTGLLLEFIAIRPIAVGEEITMNYGDVWQQAWNHHVATYQPPNGSDTYVYAHKLNAALSNLPTEDEEPIPANLQLQCYIPGTLLEQPMTTSLLWPANAPVKFHPSQLQPCRILERHGVTYTVQLESLVTVRQVPRAVIQYRDVVYSTDQNLHGSFRRWIESDLFPESWKDLS